MKMKSIALHFGFGNSFLPLSKIRYLLFYFCLFSTRCQWHPPYQQTHRKGRNNANESIFSRWFRIPTGICSQVIWLALMMKCFNGFVICVSSTTTEKDATVLLSGNKPEKMLFSSYSFTWTVSQPCLCG